MKPSLVDDRTSANAPARASHGPVDRAPQASAPEASRGAARRRVVRRLSDILPRGRTLPPDAWERRNRAILTLLWLHAAAIPAFGLARGYGVAHTLGHALPLVIPAIVGSCRASRRMRGSIVALGLLSASALLVHESGGLIEAHFHFFVVIIVLTLYEDWVVFLLAVGYVVLHHGALGALQAEAVFSHAGAQAHPWRWAAIHGAFVAAAGVAAVTGWRLNEGVRAESENALVRARSSEELFRRSFEDAPIGMVLTALDGSFLEVNRSFCKMLGYKAEDLLGTRFHEVTHPDDVEVGAAELARAAAGEIRTVRIDKRYIHANRAVIWASVSASLIRPQGRPPYFITQIADVTERRRAEERARLAGEKARRQGLQQAAIAALGQYALSGVQIQELCDEAVRVVAETLDAPFARIMELASGGEQVRQIAARGWPDRIVERLAGTDSQPAYTLLNGQPVVVEDVATETRFDVGALRSLGIASGMSVVVAERDGRETYAVLVVHSKERRAFSPDDLNFLQAVANVLAGAIEQQRAEQHLRHQSLHDPLTELPNRVLFLDRLEHALARVERAGGTLTVMFLDVDQFKIMNDSLGHDAGDALLRAVASRLASQLRETDTLARFGGDEFVVLSEDLGQAEDAVAVAERMRAALASPVEIGDSRHVVSASIGIVVAAGGYRGGSEAMLRDADAAMYRAKAAGRDRYEVFDELMRARVVHHLETEGELRRALERSEFRLVYQPLVSLDSGRSLRCEALLRWNHPTRGIVPTREPLAERGRPGRASHRAAGGARGRPSACASCASSASNRVSNQLWSPRGHRLHAHLTR